MRCHDVPQLVRGRVKANTMQAEPHDEAQHKQIRTVKKVVTAALHQEERIRCSAIFAIRSSLSNRRRQITAMMNKAAPLVCAQSQKNQHKLILQMSTTGIYQPEAVYKVQCGGLISSRVRRTLHQSKNLAD